MTRNLSYTFPAGNTSDVCAIQTSAGAGNLILNSNLANQYAYILIQLGAAEGTIANSMQLNFIQT